MEVHNQDEHQDERALALHGPKSDVAGVSNDPEHMDVARSPTPEYLDESFFEIQMDSAPPAIDIGRMDHFIGMPSVSPEASKAQQLKAVALPKESALEGSVPLNCNLTTDLHFLSEDSFETNPFDQLSSSGQDGLEYAEESTSLPLDLSSTSFDYLNNTFPQNLFSLEHPDPQSKRIEVQRDHRLQGAEYEVRQARHAHFSKTDKAEQNRRKHYARELRTARENFKAKMVQVRQDVGADDKKTPTSTGVRQLRRIGAREFHAVLRKVRREEHRVDKLEAQEVHASEVRERRERIRAISHRRALKNLHAQHPARKLKIGMIIQDGSAIECEPGSSAASTEPPIDPTPIAHSTNPASLALDSPKPGTFVIVSLQPYRFVVLRLEESPDDAREKKAGLERSIPVIDSRATDQIADAKEKRSESYPTLVADMRPKTSPLAKGTICDLAAPDSWDYETIVKHVGTLKADGRDQLVNLFQEYVLKHGAMEEMGVGS